MTQWALYSKLKRLLRAEERVPQKRPYLLADAVALSAVLLAHNCACGVYIYDSGSDYAFSILTDLVVIWGWLVFAYGVRLPSCLSMTFCAGACALVVLDICSFVMAGVPVHVESLELLASHGAIVFKNISMLTSAQIMPSLAMLTLATGIISLVRTLANVYYEHAFLRRLSKTAERPLVFLVVSALLLLYWVHHPTYHVNVLMRFSREMFLEYRQLRSRPAFVSNELQYFVLEKKNLLEVNPRPHTSLFVISLESVRASAFNVYNKDVPKELTPYISSLVDSGEATVFHDVTASIPHTMKVLYTTLCGVPAHPGPTWVDYAYESPYLAHCLPKLLRDLGWSTRFLTSSSVGLHPRLGFEKNMGSVDIVQEAIRNGENQPYQPSGFMGYDERILLEPTRKWLEGLGPDQPAFGYYTTVSTHSPYIVANVTRANGLSKVVNRAAKSFRGVNSKKQQYASYLAAVADSDAFVEDLVKVIDQSQKGKDAVIVIIGDHGEAFGEHASSFLHGGTPYSETAHVPMLVLDRTSRAKRASPTIPKPWSSLNFRSTFLRLLGFESFDNIAPTRQKFDGSSNSAEPRDIQKSMRRTVCASISASLFDERSMSCSTRNGLKIMSLVSPSRIAIFNSTRDPFDKKEVRGVPRALVKQAVKEMKKYRIMARERYREIDSDLSFGAVGMRLPKAVRGA
jgi:glucan phosphoethanolaminetransferase (alkaline phosphatase superfamily)